MKPFLFIIFFVLFVDLAHAQGNLQFNQARLITSSQTVPAGKVWKVESALVTNPIIPAVHQNHLDINTANILVNGNTVVVQAAILSHGVPGVTWDGVGFTAGSRTRFPIWLPAGTSLAASSNVVYVNVMEFNIVP